ncbi:hypothetical protein DY000_02061119 [Brassica cretica]|uniref:Uncharacterized protein n=1 Tax=Brassica cretica TaxID=69181 RepID=A0ABQ7AQ10_BRACR|nr:hypothetical protein DY000_02061119 [Brassica cretica]
MRMSNQSLLYSFDNHIWFDRALQNNHRYDVAVKLRRVKLTRSRAAGLSGCSSSFFSFTLISAGAVCQLDSVSAYKIDVLLHLVDICVKVM